MGNYLSMAVIAAGLVTAVLILLTAEPKISRRLTASAGAAALLGGLLIYGYGYIYFSGSCLQAMLHAVFSVCRMFIGDADFGEIAEAPLFTSNWALAICWCLHVLAFYATSSAAISLVGANALRNLRVRFQGHHCIIYGVTENTIAFGNESTHNSLIYVAEEIDSVLSESILDQGNVLRTDANAWKGNEQFIKSLGISKKRGSLSVYCLHTDHAKNIAYASTILNSCRSLGVHPDKFKLFIKSEIDQFPTDTRPEDTVLSADPEYESITVFEEADLAARLLIQKYPPCHTLSFDQDGRTQDNFETLVIGFGQLGQTILRQLIMNGQFVGSTFRADVFAPDIEETNGHFVYTYPGLMDHYDLHFHSHDGRSQALYRHVSERLDHIKYIVVCTNDERGNAEIAEELRSYLTIQGKTIPIHQCTHQGIKTTNPTTTSTVEGKEIHPNVLDRETVFYSIYHPDVLDFDKQDRLAMAINTSYMGSASKGLVQDWLRCNYFSRASCRAYADFVDSMLYVAQKTAADAMRGQWNFSDAQLEVLGRMEHARWNAFHFAMGFRPMSDEEFRQRARIYEEQRASGSARMIRVTKNMEKRSHACLVSWEELVDLAQKEYQVTGKLKDYQQMDIDNVMLIPELLKLRNTAADK